MKKNLGCLLFSCVILLFLAGGYVALLKAQREVRRSMDRLGADIIVYPAGAEEKDQPLLISLFPTFMFLRPSVLEMVRSVPGVEVASPISYVQSLSAICCESEVRLIGIDLKSNFVVPALLREGSLSSLKGQEFIAGFRVGTSGPDHPKEMVGAKIVSAGELYTIRGVLEQTRSHADVSAFLPMEEAEQMLRVLSDRYGWNRKPGFPSAILIKVKEGFSVHDVAGKITKKEAGIVPVMAPVSVLSSKESLVRVCNLLHVIEIFLLSFSVITVFFLVFSIWKGRRSKAGLTAT